MVAEDLIRNTYLKLNEFCNKMNVLESKKMLISKYDMESLGLLNNLCLYISWKRVFEEAKETFRLVLNWIDRRSSVNFFGTKCVKTP